MPSTALQDLRVIDLTSGPAGGLATMILADFGAEVIRIVRPDGDPLDELAAAPMWHRGKTAITRDLKSDAGLTELHELLAGADVLVCNWRAKALRARGLDYDAVRARHPHLVYAHISAFGSTGPLADMPGYEHLIAAYAGRMFAFARTVGRDGPVFSALQVGIHACAQSTVSGVLAAVLTRGDDGEGSLVETSLLQGMLPYEQGAMLYLQFSKNFPNLPPMVSDSDALNPAPLYYTPAQAGDGRWMQFGNLLPHLFDNFLIVTELADVLADPAFDHKQLLLTDPERHVAFRERLLERIQDRGAADWMADIIADGGIVATPYQTTQEALQDPDIVANGHATEIAPDVWQLGPLARMTKTPAELRLDGDETLPTTWRSSPRATPTRHRKGELPLAGVRVVEIATIIAAPLGASFLADLGAEVIKIEQIGGDPYRGLGAGIGSARVNAGKRSISLNLKSVAGQQAAQALAATADVLIHNYRPGVPERLGIGYADISAVNADIVYLQVNGYGPDGPGAQRPSTHPIPGAAMGGVMYQMGESLPSDILPVDDVKAWTDKLFRANEVNPDPNTALVVASSALLGLTARQRSGVGQQMFVDMFGANAYANHDDFLSYPGKVPRPLGDPLMHGLGPTYRLYECAEHSWVFLALTNQAERARFADAIDGLSPGELSEPDDVVTARLAALFVEKHADDWEALCVAASIGCVRADRAPAYRFWLEDPQAQALGLSVPAEHPAWGAYERHGVNVRLADTTPPHAPPPLAGQHNRELLASVGYSDADIDAMLAAGDLWAQE